MSYQPTPTRSYEWVFGRHFTIPDLYQKISVDYVLVFLWEMCENKGQTYVRDVIIDKHLKKVVPRIKSSKIIKEANKAKTPRKKNQPNPPVIPVVGTWKQQFEFRNRVLSSVNNNHDHYKVEYLLECLNPQWILQKVDPTISEYGISDPTNIALINESRQSIERYEAEVKAKNESIDQQEQEILAQQEEKRLAEEKRIEKENRPSLGERFSKWAREHWIPVLLGLIVVLWVLYEKNFLYCKDGIEILWALITSKGK